MIKSYFQIGLQPKIGRYREHTIYTPIFTELATVKLRDRVMIRDCATPVELGEEPRDGVEPRAGGRREVERPAADGAPVKPGPSHACGRRSADK